MAASKLSNRVLIIGFMILLLIPNIVIVLQDHAIDPRLEFNPKKPKEIVTKFKNFYTENFGLKAELFSLYKTIKTKALKDDVLPNRVVAGKEEWYFLGNHYNNVLDDSFGNKAISNYELFLIFEKISHLKKSLQKRGIDLILVVPPNKHSIYGENLPFQLSKNPTVLSQLKSHLKKTIDFEIFDLSSAISGQKNEHQMYYRSNTHWTDIGAFYGYNKTMEIIENKTQTIYPKVTLADYDPILMPIKEADITKMIQLDVKEKVIYLQKKTPEKGMFIQTDGIYIQFKNARGKKKLLMYKDSFANAMIPFFNESFAEAWYTTVYNIDYDFIDRIKPDVVVIEIVERNLIYNLINSKKPLE